MLNAAALLIGPQDAAMTELAGLAASLGFSRTLPFAGVAAAEREAGFTPLLFCLCSRVADIATLKPVADALRQSPSMRIRFAALVYLAHAPAIETIRACIGMGFDDVIALPSPLRALRDRLHRQIGKPLTYTEIGDYFGPERPSNAGDVTDGPVRRIEIVRNVTTGIEILQDEVEMVV